MKRTGTIVIGSLLVLRGLRRRSIRGVMTALVGAGLLARTLRDTDRDRTDNAGYPHDTPDIERPTTPTISRSVTIDESADELYEAWRDPNVFSQVMGRFAEVTSTGEDTYHWTVQGPGDREFSWETRTVESEPGEFIRWQTMDDASVPNSGTVRFHAASGDRGTLVTLSLDFDPPGGTVGDRVLKRLDVVPETLAGLALGRFKSIVESGEAPTLEGNPSGRGKGDSL
jgi:uncharacterized membrane protein